jgi:hypothetical protein
MLKFDTHNPELIEAKHKSAKFRRAWHHAVGRRGVSARVMQ